MDEGWMEDGACSTGATYLGRPVDPEWWFPRSTERGGQLARLICRTHCPVVAECLAYALHHEVQGVWGGTGERERYGKVSHSKPRMGEEHVWELSSLQ